MKPYEKYIPSGIDWIGDIPEHWGLGFLKRYCSVTDGSHSSPKTKTTGLFYVSVKDVANDFIDFRNCKLVSENDFDLLEKNGCKPKVGDVLLTKDGTIGRAAIVKDDYPPFVILSSLGIISPSKRIISKFLYYYLISGINIDQMFSVIHGSALTRLTIDKINNLLITIPNIAEQTAIANFLDERITAIDALLEKRKQLIKLYKEKKQGIINNAVTRGLDETVPLVDSGFEWLGEIPMHWEVKRLKYMTEINPNKDVGLGKDSEDSVVFLPMEKVHATGNYDGDCFKSVKSLFKGFTYFKRNDVILAKITPCFENGKSALLDQLSTDFGFGSTEFHVLRASTNLKKKYLYYIIKSSMFMILGEAFMTGSAGQKRVTTDFVRNFKIGFPSLIEQEAIVQFIETECGKIDKIIDKLEQQIELYKEYRTALISEVVTGKVKVRGGINA